MRKRVTVTDLIRMREQGEKISMLTAYDYTFSTLLDSAGVDVILVGDSLGQVIKGESNTLAVTLDEIIYHTKAVVRGALRAMVIADMPFMSYQLGPEQALSACGRVLKESGAQAVKLEGGEEIAESISKITRAGIPVLGHVGLQPQSVFKYGGYKVRGKSEEEQKQILNDARAGEAAGAFAIVLEAIPAVLAEEITAAIQIPTIGIGAGPNCSGQVLVLHDLLGLTIRKEGEKKPQFVREYAQLGHLTKEAVAEYCLAVKKGQFPSAEHIYSVVGSRDQ